MYDSPDDSSMLTIEIILILTILFFIKTEIMKYQSMLEAGHAGVYFQDFMTWVELSLISCFSFALVMRSIFYLDPRRLKIDILTTEYVNMIDLGAVYFNAMAFEGLMYILQIAKLFKFFKLNRRMYALFDNLSLAGLNVVFFFIFFMICIGAFAVCGMQLFGTLMLQYSRIDLVFGNLLLVLLGDFDYEEFNQATAGSTVGFAFFMAYLLLMIFVVINLLLGILGDAYTESKENMTEGIRLDRLEKGRQAYQVIDEVPVYETVVEDIKETLHCDGAAFFVYHRQDHELWSLTSKGDLVRLDATHGIAGYCVEHMEPVLVHNAYADKRFDPEMDRLTNYTTHHVVAVPVYDKNDEVTGVLQGMNKLQYDERTHMWALSNDSFSRLDLEQLQGYTSRLTKIVESQNALQDLRRRMRRVNHSANILWKEMTQPYHEKKQLVPEPGELEYRESEAPYRAPKRAPRKVDQAASNGRNSVLS